MSGDPAVGELAALTEQTSGQGAALTPCVSKRDAHIAWSALAEPGDTAAGWLVTRLGAVAAREWLDVVVEDPVTATMTLAEHADERTIDEVVRVSERWARRRAQSQVPQLRERATQCGARPVAPGDPEWPASFADLGEAAPMALWVRGQARLDESLERSVALVGSRASSSYGEHMAATLAGELSDAGWTVVSGGAYGIDAAAHRGVLAAGGATVAVMAGGVDRLYPAGNQHLLEKIIDTGAVVSETPPGWAPHRHRFLERNRLIACANATVVVEAAYRSGALSTATHAQELARPVGAVPGAVTSAASAGCHRLIRESGAVLVTSAADVIEIAGPLQVRDVPAPSQQGGATTDFETPHDRAVFDALGKRSKDVDSLAHVAGLTHAEVRAALGRMELTAMVHMEAGRWRRTTPNP